MSAVSLSGESFWSDGIVFDAAIATLLPVIAWTALAHPHVMAGVMLFITFGIILSLAWFRLDAPDVAIAEAAIGAGLTGVLMIGALAALARIARSQSDGLSHDPIDAPEPIGAGATVATIVGITVAAGGLTIALAGALQNIPADHEGRAAGLALDARALVGAENAVNAVLLSYRALDTLLEKAVLIIALLGVVVVGAGETDEAPAERHAVFAGSAGPLGALAALILPVAFVTAAYLVAIGTDSPGGAFQGGTVAAAGLLIGILAGRLPHPGPGSRLVVGTASTAILAFIVVLAAGAIMGPGIAGPPMIAGDQKIAIVAAEIALTIGIAAILTSLALGDRGRWDGARRSGAHGSG